MSKPGCIAVNAKGERFSNEASVHFVQAMHKTGSVPAYIINDAAGVKKYGLGMVYPGAPNLKKLLQAGYVTESTTLRALAHKIGVDPGGLERTVSRVNELATSGKDADFAQGDTMFDQEIGDQKNMQHPCFVALREGPLYARH